MFNGDDNITVKSEEGMKQWGCLAIYCEYGEDVTENVRMKHECRMYFL
ncbi:MAG: hypothetical protein KAT65_20895 [Methanophagales archaeon]|nr:hypothetical protein [Methanophagales archaeon]